MANTDNTSSTSIEVSPNRIRLYRRARSSYWQARFKLDDGRWYRQSTGTADQEQAVAEAWGLYYAAKERARHGLPNNTRRFSDVASYAIKRMEDELSAEAGKSVYRDYITAITTYLIPFFGKRDISSIKYKDLSDYERWRGEKIAQRNKERKRGALIKRVHHYGRLRKALAELENNAPTFHVVAQSTINTHNAALSRIFDEAEIRGWLARGMRPELQNKGRKSIARPHFTLSEHKVITDKLRSNWWRNTRRADSQHLRRMLREYVLILSNTGVRTGTEAINIKWNNIQYYLDTRDKTRYIEIHVSGKTGPRTLIARFHVRVVLERLKNYYSDFVDKTLDEVIAAKSDRYLFIDHAGNQIQSESLRQCFRKFLTDHNLLYGVDGQQRTLYSFRHFYATRALVRQTSIYALAQQMGTSVAMLEEFYSKFLPRDNAAQLAGRERVTEPPRDLVERLDEIDAAETAGYDKT